MLFRNLYIDGQCADLVVRNGHVVQLCAAGGAVADHEEVYDCGGTLWALPGLCNMHTHSAMTLLRSLGSGLPLQRWLQEAIFPAEARLTAADIHAGALEACHEMRRGGTTAFNDMYFEVPQTVDAARQTGMLATVGLSVTDADFDDADRYRVLRRFLDECEHHLDTLPYGVRLSIAPHSVYAVSGPHLKYLADFAGEHGLLMHMHLSETEKERCDCQREHGLPPALYLDKLGVLSRMGRRLVVAHALWLDDDEIQLLGGYHVTAVHNPNSNLKLGSGYNFPYEELRDAGVNVCLGTDGCASSDNLDMVEAMKVLSLLQKGWRHDPSVLPADELLRVASLNGLRAMGFDDGGIAEGHFANMMFVDLNHPAFNHIRPATVTAPVAGGVAEWHGDAALQRQLLDRLIYAAHGDAIAATLVGDNYTKY